MSEAHWHILGAGAMGCWFAAALARSPAAVTLLLRPEAPCDPVLVERGGQRFSTDLPCETANSAGPIEHLLVTTKAYDVAVALDAVAHRLRPGASVLLLVNGMGLLAPLQQRYPGLRFFRGTTTAGALRLGPRHIRHAGDGTTLIGREGQTEPADWFADWRDHVDHCRWDAQINRALWHKLAVNSVINPLTALHRCSNGELARRADLVAAVDALCAEACQISYAAGYTETARTLRDAVREVIERTASNRSSMLQDVEHDRPTEIRFINGYLLQVAAAHAIAAPQHSALFEEVLGLGN